MTFFRPPKKCGYKNICTLRDCTKCNVHNRSLLRVIAKAAKRDKAIEKCKEKYGKKIV